MTEPEVKFSASEVRFIIRERTELKDGLLDIINRLSFAGDEGTVLAKTVRERLEKLLKDARLVAEGKEPSDDPDPE